MVFLGVIVAVAAVVVGIELVVQNSSSASLNLFGHNVPGVHNEAQVLMAGMIVAFIVGAGFAVSSVSLLRKMRVRRELHDLREEREESMATMEAKNQQLQRELARLRRGAQSAPVTGETTVSPGPRSDREPVSPFFDNRA
jgi:uncharacterized integral membrane protein